MIERTAALKTEKVEVIRLVKAADKVLAEHTVQCLENAFILLTILIQT